MLVATRIAQFLHALGDRITVDVDTTLRQHLFAWFDYYQCLHIILKRHHEFHERYVCALTGHGHQRHGVSNGRTHPHQAVPTAGTESETLRLELLRETRSFYVFAGVVLDRIAHALIRYFALPWSRTEATHAQLTRHFQALCQHKALLLPQDDLVTLMHDVHTRLDNHPTTIQDIASHDLAQAMPLMDRYIMAMIEMFELNFAQSVFSSSDRAQLMELRSPLRFPLPQQS